MNSAPQQPVDARMQCMEVWGGNRAIDRYIETPGLRIWAYCKPYGGSMFGGDVYYLSSCASGRITRTLLADVAGHGEAVAAVAAGLRDLMRRNVNFIKQTRLVKAMNQQFLNANQGAQFATAVVATFFSPTRTLTVCNAGHPPPLLARRDSGIWNDIANESDQHRMVIDIPLGIAPETCYTQHQVVLNPGDLMMTFSDAVIESQDRNGQLIGQAGIRDLLADVDTSAPESIIPNVLTKLEQLHERNLCDDDLTILLFQATGDGPNWKDNLLAPLRLTRQVKVSPA